MAYVISFRTAMFDASAEDPNPINPIAGQSVLRWLKRQVGSSGCVSSEPDTEDWGWYMYTQYAERSYLVGASGEPDPTGPTVDWTIQVDKQRSVKEKLLGKAKLAADDPFVKLVEQVIKAERQLAEPSVERDA